MQREAMRPQKAIRGDKAPKVHLVRADNHLRVMGTACYAYIASDVLTTSNPAEVTCAGCRRKIT